MWSRSKIHAECSEWLRAKKDRTITDRKINKEV